MIKYQIIDHVSLDAVSGPIWSKEEAIEKANAMKAEAKGKRDFDVCQLAMVYSTESQRKKLVI